MIVVVDDQCGDIFTYKIDGASSVYLGQGDLHDSSFDDMRYSVDFARFARYEGPDHPVNGTETYTEMFADTSKGHCKVCS